MKSTTLTPDGVEGPWRQPIGLYLRKSLREAAKLFLMDLPFRTRLVSETIRVVIGSDQRRPCSTPSSPEQSQTLFRFTPVYRSAPAVT
jgi:hypothetical protein